MDFMISLLMQKEYIEYEQAIYCLKITNYKSVEAASYYLNNKDRNGRYTHALIKLGGLCAICERPHTDHTAFYEEQYRSENSSSYD